jgi:hypothetical protein
VVNDSGCVSELFGELAAKHPLSWKKGGGFVRAIQSGKIPFGVGEVAQVLVTANSPWYLRAALFRQRRINSGFTSFDFIVEISDVPVFAVRCSRHLTG